MESGVSVQLHTVQHSWFLNSFIFASRPWSSAPPKSSSYKYDGTDAEAAAADAGVAPAPNTSNSCGLSASQRAAVIAEWKAEKRDVKRERRALNWSDEQRAKAEAMRWDRESRWIKVRIEPLSSKSLRLSCMLEVHDNVFVPLGRKASRLRYSEAS